MNDPEQNKTTGALLLLIEGLYPQLNAERIKQHSAFICNADEWRLDDMLQGRDTFESLVRNESGERKVILGRIYDAIKIIRNNPTLCDFAYLERSGIYLPRTYTNTLKAAHGLIIGEGMSAAEAVLALRVNAYNETRSEKQLDSVHGVKIHTANNAKFPVIATGELVKYDEQY